MPVAVGVGASPFPSFILFVQKLLRRSPAFASKMNILRIMMFPNALANTHCAHDTKCRAWHG